MLLSNDEKAVKKARFWATQAREPAPYYQHEEIGYNYRMSNIVAGIGRGQLHYLDQHIQRKREIYETYKEGFIDLPITMNPYLKDSKPNFWLSCILLNKDVTQTNPAQIREKLEKYNIESRPIWKPMHLQPVFQNNDFNTVDKNTDVGGDIFSRGLCLPSDVKITEEDQEKVITLIKGFFR